MARRRPRTLAEAGPRGAARPGQKCKDWKGWNCAPHAVEYVPIGKKGEREAGKQLDLFLETKEDSES